MGLSETEFGLLMNIIQLLGLAYISYLGKKIQGQAQDNGSKADQLRDEVRNGK